MNVDSRRAGKKKIFTSKLRRDTLWEGPTSWGSPTRVGYSSWNQLSMTRPCTNLKRCLPAMWYLYWWIIPELRALEKNFYTQKNRRMMTRQITYFPFGMVTVQGQTSQGVHHGPPSNEQFSCMTLLCEPLGDPTRQPKPKTKIGFPPRKLITYPLKRDRLKEENSPSCSLFCTCFVVRFNHTVEVWGVEE